MNLWLGIQIGLKEIWAHKFRSFLTMLGVILGVASLQSMFSLTAGIAIGMRESLQSVGGVERIGVVNKEVSEKNSAIAELSPGITMNDTWAIRSGARLISHVSPVVMINGIRARSGNVDLWGRLEGAMPDFMTVDNHEIAVGRFITELDVERGERVVVLGWDFAHELFPGIASKEMLGKTFGINERPFTVVGIFKLYESDRDRVRRELMEQQRARSGRTQEGRVSGGRRGGHNMYDRKNRSLVAPITTVQMEFKGVQMVANVDQGPDLKLSNLSLRVSDVERFDEALEQVTSILNHTHRGIDDFGFETREDWFDSINRSVNSTRLSGGIIAAISLVVGGIGIANIMLASITERVREIGIRMAVGARQRDIFVQILVESVVTAFIGGVLGLVASAGMTKVLILLAPSENPPVTELTSLLISFSSAIIIGIVAGIYPAIKAASLDPIQALRYE